MELSLASISLIAQIFLIIYSVRVWHWRCLLFPGFYFGLLWAFGIVGSQLFIAVGLLNVVSEENIAELYSFVLFTSLCFIFFTWKSRHKVSRDTTIQIQLLSSFRLYKIVSCFVLLISIVTFVRAGASFDMGASREAMHSNVENQSVFTGYGQVLALPLSIIAGSLLGQVLLKKKKLSYKNILFLFVPLFSNLIFSIYLGGRVNFVYGFIQYCIGFCLVLKIKQESTVSKRILKLALVSVIVLSSFISLVAVQRQNHYRGESIQYELIAKQGSIYAILYGPIEYMTASFNGYQYRRSDAVDENDLTYGTRTLNGFINWSLPFAGRFGLQNFTIADVLDIRYDNQETYDFDREYYYCTHSCYIPLVKDFGSGGTYFAIIFLTWISNFFFIRLQQKRSIVRASSIFFYYIFLDYWLKSNYYGTLSGSIMITLYGLLIFDFINYLSRKKQTNKNDA